MTTISTFTNFLAAIKPSFPPSKNTCSLAFNIPNPTKWEVKENYQEGGIRLRQWYPVVKLLNTCEHRITAQTKYLPALSWAQHKTELFNELNHKFNILSWKEHSNFRPQCDGYMLEWSKTGTHTTFLFTVIMWHRSHCFTLEYETKNPNISSFEKSTCFSMLKNAQIVLQHEKQA